MSIDLTRFRRTLPATAVMLMLVGCGSATTPTEVGIGERTTGAAAAGAAAEPSSIIIEGVVTDSANRPLGGSHLICSTSGYACTGVGHEVISQHRPGRGQNADGAGRYAIKVTGNSGGRFILNAHSRGYESGWQEIDFPGGSCRAGNPDCTFTIDFALKDLAD